MNGITRLLIPVAVLGLLAPLTVSATAAVDTTPPVWTKLPTAAIPLGARLNPAGDWDQECVYVNMPVTATWRAADPESGIDHYGYGFEIDPTWYPNVGLTTKGTVGAYVLDDVCGGGGARTDFLAFNGAGLYARAAWGANALSVVQDDGGWWPRGSGREQSGGPELTYKRTWSTSACNCWTGGTTQKTSQSAASVSISVADVYGEAHGFGLVMAKGPDRGKAAIFVNGVKVATIDTYSATKVNRTVVWRQEMTKRYYTVKVVNLATPGRPRIDIDAFVLLDKTNGYALD